MQLTSIVHILSPETYNCPSWISGREKMTLENISWSWKNAADLGGGWTRDLLVSSRTAHPTEPPRLAHPTCNCQPITLLDPDCWYKFTYLMPNSVDPEDLKKPTDLDLHCLQRQDISRLSRTRVNTKPNQNVIFCCCD